MSKYVGLLFGLLMLFSSLVAVRVAAGEDRTNTISNNWIEMPPAHKPAHYFEITMMPSGMWVGNQTLKTESYLSVSCHWVDTKDFVRELADFIREQEDSLPLVVELNNQEIWRSNERNN